MQKVLHCVDVLDPAVRHVPFVAEDKAGRNDELARVEAVAKRQRPENATIADGMTSRIEPCLPGEARRGGAEQHDPRWHDELPHLSARCRR